VCEGVSPSPQGERSEKGQTSPAEVGDNNYHADTKDFIQVYREQY